MQPGTVQIKFILKISQSIFEICYEDTNITYLQGSVEKTFYIPKLKYMTHYFENSNKPKYQSNTETHPRNETK